MPRDGTLPEAPPLHPLEIELGQEWQSAQLAQNHVGTVAGKVIMAWQQARAELAAAAKQIVALQATVAERDARIAELERQATTVEPLGSGLVNLSEPGVQPV